MRLFSKQLVPSCGQKNSIIELSEKALQVSTCYWPWELVQKQPYVRFSSSSPYVNFYPSYPSPPPSPTSVGTPHNSSRLRNNAKSLDGQGNLLKAPVQSSTKVKDPAWNSSLTLSLLWLAQEIFSTCLLLIPQTSDNVWGPSLHEGVWETWEVMSRA